MALPPPTTAHGALLAHVTGGHLEPADSADHGARSYQPMNVNFGLFPPPCGPLKSDNGRRLRGTQKSLAKKRALTRRALDDLDRWITGELPVAAE
jgi:methylenetetrahydrofolate--tRNA-(uracil-5-)-methyltransferase